jgi:ribosomal protein L37E
MKMIIIETSPQNDADDVRWEGTKGYGYRPKEGDRTIGLMRCPKCGAENYSMSVASGICFACGFDANKK